MKIRDGKLPTGKGMFIWLLERCSGGDMNKLVEECLIMKFNWVSIKVANGVSVYKGSYWTGRQQQALLDQVVPLLKAAGIEVHFWGYSYGLRPGRESNPILEMIAKHKPLSYTINAEKEYKEPGMANAASVHIKAIKWGMEISASDEIPDIPILLSSYRWPSVHPEFPWRAFADLIDAWNPQVYWQGASNPVDQLIRSVKENQKIKNVPVIPAGTIYPHGNWWPTPAQLRRFDAAAQNLGLLGVHYWEWYYGETKKPELWQEIKTHSWEDLPEPPTPEPSLGLEQAEIKGYNQGLNDLAKETNTIAEELKK